VSDVDPSASSHEDSRRPPLDDLAGLLGDAPVVVREGLPRTYRMRADSHYVDQLESRHDSRAIRLIATDDIDAADGAAADIKLLTQSIAAHGVLQPLLVRRSGVRYRLIAGRKRLLAASAAGLSEVPCLVHDADDAKAAALAEADNLREGTGAEPAVEAFTTPSHLHHVLASISAELAALDSSAVLLRTAPLQSFQRRVAVDLMQAQSWRAAWLARAASLAVGDPPEGSLKPLNCVLDRIQTGFEAEARLTGLHLDVSVATNAASFPLDDDRGLLAIGGGIFTTLSWLQGVDKPRVEVHAEAPNPRLLKIEIVQRLAPIPADAARTLQDPATSELAASLGWLAMNSLVATQGGSVETTAVRGRGSVIRLTIGGR
jgi:ParB-like nuclease family protein